MTCLSVLICSRKRSLAPRQNQICAEEERQPCNQKRSDHEASAGKPSGGVGAGVWRIRFLHAHGAEQTAVMFGDAFAAKIVCALQAAARCRTLRMILAALLSKRADQSPPGAATLGSLEGLDRRLRPSAAPARTRQKSPAIFIFVTALLNAFRPPAPVFRWNICQLMLI